MEQTCYRHPDRETGVSCSSCGRPICVDCMTPTNVGMRCPECSKQKTKVVAGPAAFGRSDPQASIAIIGITVAVFAAQVLFAGGARAQSGWVYENGALFGPLVDNGEVWRLLTYGLLHADPIHLLLNMVGVFFLGQFLEPTLGPARFTAMYLASLFAGALGAMIEGPGNVTVGASGGVFGLMGGAIVLLRNSGIDIWRSPIMIILGINLLFTFTNDRISKGGHVGGLVGGLLCAALILAAERQGGRNARALGVAACALVAVASIVVAVWASGQPSLYDGF